MKINFFLRIRGFFFLFLLLLSVAAISSLFQYTNYELYEFIVDITVFCIVIYLPIFIIFAIKNVLTNRYHDSDENPTNDHSLKYAFAFVVMSFLLLIYSPPPTAEQKEQYAAREEQREKEMWAKKRLRGAPMLSNSELLDKEIGSVCYHGGSTTQYRNCIERIKNNYSTSLNLTWKEKRISSIEDWCYDWRKLGYESSEICEEDQKKIDGISD